MQSLDGKHTLFGEVAEDESGVVERLNAAITDEGERPLQNIRIRRTEVLDDPFEDPEGLVEMLPEASPEPVYEFGDRLEEDWVPQEDTRCAPGSLPLIEFDLLHCMGGVKNTCGTDSNTSWESCRGQCRKALRPCYYLESAVFSWVACTAGAGSIDMCQAAQPSKIEEQQVAIDK